MTNDMIQNQNVCKSDIYSDNQMNQKSENRCVYNSAENQQVVDGEQCPSDIQYQAGSVSVLHGENVQNKICDDMCVYNHKNQPHQTVQTADQIIQNAMYNQSYINSVNGEIVNLIGNQIPKGENKNISDKDPTYQGSAKECVNLISNPETVGLYQQLDSQQTAVSVLNKEETLDSSEVDSLTSIFECENYTTEDLGHDDVSTQLRLQGGENPSLTTNVTHNALQQESDDVTSEFPHANDSQKTSI